MKSFTKRLAAGAAIVVAASLPVVAHASDYVGTTNDPQVSDYTGELPATGANVAKMAWIGAGSLAGGSILVIGTRRRLRKAQASS